MFLETLNEPWEQIGKYVGNGFCGRDKIASGEVIAIYKKYTDRPVGLEDIQK